MKREQNCLKSINKYFEEISFRKSVWLLCKDIVTSVLSCLETFFFNLPGLAYILELGYIDKFSKVSSLKVRIYFPLF